MAIKFKSKSRVVEDRKGNRTKEKEFNFSYDSSVWLQLAKIFFGQRFYQWRFLNRMKVEWGSVCSIFKKDAIRIIL